MQECILCYIVNLNLHIKNIPSTLTNGVCFGLPIFFSMAFISVVQAQEPTPLDKSDYHLFNPTPREQMREMSTDRPDKTESPYTVDAGHFQIESDILTYSHDHDKSRGGDVITERWSAAPVNLKVGLLNHMDFQMVIESFNHVRTKDQVEQTAERQSGFGDMTFRLKNNFWGNDGGKTSFGIMPFVKVPTSQDRLGNNDVEGGVIFPLAVELPMGWSMGLMTEMDFLRNENNNHYHNSYVNSITFSHDIIGKLGGYTEFFSELSSQSDARWIGTVDLGLTYALTQDIQLDAGVNIGVTESADDLNPFVGFSCRF